MYWNKNNQFLEFLGNLVLPHAASDTDIAEPTPAMVFIIHYVKVNMVGFGSHAIDGRETSSDPANN